MTEVIVTLKAPPLSAFGRSLTSAQQQATRNVLSAVPASRISWRYHIVANGFAGVLRKQDVGALARVPGIARVWPNVTYHSLVNQSPQVIGADKLWGPALATTGQGIKIGVIDDGIDAKHRYFDPAGYSYPPGFPKGQKALATPKVIVQRAFAPPGADAEYAGVPFDPANSFHGTHVAGIAAGNHDVPDGPARC
jgi:minor extracellular serine protease Vpr